jgi:hypothetical protein
VAEVGERLGEARVVDVAARAAQQVTVKDQDLDEGQRIAVIRFGPS